MKKYICSFSFFALLTLLAACQKQHQGFAGTFVDSFDNKFTLNTDYSAYIQLAGNTKVDTTSWSDGDRHDRNYATIEFNGDKTHYYLMNNRLYRSESDMYGETRGLEVTYIND